MSLDKTNSDKYRLPLTLDNYPVSDNLPSHFESLYPKFLQFMETYYESYDSSDGPAAALNDLQHNRDLEDLSPQLLKFLGNEFFSGNDYIEGFKDKKSAIQVSNLLYRSKGTSYSIQQFFRLFFGSESEVRYGRDHIFKVGDPIEESLTYISNPRYYTKTLSDGGSRTLVEVPWPGKRLQFQFDDGNFQVLALALTPKVEVVPSFYILEKSETPAGNVNYIETPVGQPRLPSSSAISPDDPTYPDYLYIVETETIITFNAYYELIENIDYIVDFNNKSINFLSPGVTESKAGWKNGDPWLDYLSINGKLSPPTDIDGNVPDRDPLTGNISSNIGKLLYPKSKVNISRPYPSGSFIGSDISDKKITDNGYYQLFSLLILNPIAIKTWREVYKDLIHPAGMYLAGEVIIESSSDMKISSQPGHSSEQYAIPVGETVSISDGQTAVSEITELNRKFVLKNSSFRSVWTTTAAAETITIPVQNQGTFNAVIDWGDGTEKSTVDAYNSSNLAHTYATAGDHTISITGSFPNIHFNNGGDKLKIKKILNLGQVGWINLDYAFYGCSNLTEFTATYRSTPLVTTMEGMFAHCTGLTDIDVSLDTSSVTNMYFMFYNCNALTSLDVSSFDTSSVLSMHYMFFDCSGLTSLDVSSFNTSAVTDMNHMFFTRGVLTSIVGVEDFDITGLDSTGDLTDFLTGGRMTTAQYDNLLVKWEAQAVFSGLTPSFGASTYTGGSAAATARAALSSNDSWNITDGGIA